MAKREEMLRRLEMLDKLEAADAQEAAAPRETRAATPTELAMSGLETGLQAMDYPRAVTGGPAVAKLLGVYDPKEAEAARSFSKPYPGTGDLLERAGYLKDSPWLRGAAGVVGDIASDPTTYLSMGTSALAKGGGKLAKGINALINPLEVLSAKRSKGLYGKAFEVLDREAEQTGKKLAPSQLLHDANFQGGMDEAADALKEMNQQAGRDVGANLAEATARGARVDLWNEFRPAMTYAQELRKLGSPEAQALAQQVDDRVLAMIEKHGFNVPVDVANAEKSFLDQMIKASGFAQGPEAAHTTLARKQIAGDLRQAVPKSVTAMDAELGEKLQNAMQLYSSTAPGITDKATQIANQVRERRGPWNLSAVDMMLLGGGAAEMGTLRTPVGLSMFALKKAGQAAGTTEGRTMRGLVGKKIGESRGLVDPAARRGSWSLLHKRENEE